MSFLASLLLALTGAVGAGGVLQDRELEAAVAGFDRLQENVDPEVLRRSEAVQRLVVLHSQAVPVLRRAVESSPSWRVRLGSAYVLKEMGFKNALLPLVDDSHGLVRNFARAVLVVRPKEGLSDSARPEYFQLDAESRGWAAGLAGASVVLSPQQQERRLAAVIPDLLVDGGGSPHSVDDAARARHVAVTLVRGNPVAAAEALARGVPRDSDGVRRLLTVLQEIAPSDASQLAEFARAAGSVIDAGLGHADASVRSAGIFAALKVSPLDKRLGVVERALGDADAEVQNAVFVYALSVAEQYEDAGLSVRADEVLAALLKHASRLPDAELGKRYQGMLKGQLEKVGEERARILSGVTYVDGKGKVVVERFLRVGSEVLQVSEAEYQDALARFGSTSVSLEQFDALRDAETERIQARNARVSDAASADVRSAMPTSGLKGSGVPVALVDLVGQRQGAQGASESGSLSRSGFVVWLAFGLVVLSLLAWLVWRRSAGKA